MRTAASAQVSVDDWAFRYGWGAFETIRVHKRRPLFLAEHLARLFVSAQALQLSSDCAPEEWRSDIVKAVGAARLSEGIVNLYWTAGIPGTLKGRRIVVARDVDLAIGRRVKLWAAPWRIEATTPGVGVKSMAYFSNIFASVCARHEGHQAAIVLNSDGYIADGATMSVFVIKNGRITTPRLADGALPGVTRQRILSDAARLSILARETRIKLSDLRRADAAFVTSAMRGIAVAGSVADHAFPRLSGSVAGKIISRLRQGYNRAVAGEIAATPASF